MLYWSPCFISYTQIISKFWGLHLSKCSDPKHFSPNMSTTFLFKLLFVSLIVITPKLVTFCLSLPHLFCSFSTCQNNYFKVQIRWVTATLCSSVTFHLSNWSVRPYMLASLLILWSDHSTRLLFACPRLVIHHLTALCSCLIPSMLRHQATLPSRWNLFSEVNSKLLPLLPSGVCSNGTL